MKKQAEIDIRYTRVLDAPYLKEWMSHPAVTPRLGVCNAQEIETAASYWIYLSKYQCSLTATDNHTPCGIATLFLMPYKKVSHHSPFKICVDPKRWGEGIGTSLLKNIKHLAKNYFHLEAIHIEVFGESPLIPLLHKSGFVVFAKQERYVKTEEGYLPRTLFITDLTKEAENGSTS